jgi:hypothetical protein
MSKIGVPLTNGDLRPMTNAEQQQKWRLVHNGGPKYPKRDLLVTCIGAVKRGALAINPFVNL